MPAGLHKPDWIAQKAGQLVNAGPPPDLATGGSGGEFISIVSSRHPNLCVKALVAIAEGSATHASASEGSDPPQVGANHPVGVANPAAEDDGAATSRLVSQCENDFLRTSPPCRRGQHWRRGDAGVSAPFLRAVQLLRARWHDGKRRRKKQRRRRNRDRGPSGEDSDGDEHKALEVTFDPGAASTTAASRLSFYADAECTTLIATFKGRSENFKPFIVLHLALLPLHLESGGRGRRPARATRLGLQVLRLPDARPPVDGGAAGAAGPQPRVGVLGPGLSAQRRQHHAEPGCVHNRRIHGALLRYIRSSGSPYKARVVALLTQLLRSRSRSPGASLRTSRASRRSARWPWRARRATTTATSSRLPSGLLGLIELALTAEAAGRALGADAAGQTAPAGGGGIPREIARSTLERTRGAGDLRSTRAWRALPRGGPSGRPNRRRAPETDTNPAAGPCRRPSAPSRPRRRGPRPHWAPGARPLVLRTRRTDPAPRPLPAVGQDVVAADGPRRLKPASDLAPMERLLDLHDFASALCCQAVRARREEAARAAARRGEGRAPRRRRGRGRRRRRTAPLRVGVCRVESAKRPGGAPGGDGHPAGVRTLTLTLRTPRARRRCLPGSNRAWMDGVGGFSSSRRFTPLRTAAEGGPEVTVKDPGAEVVLVVKPAAPSESGRLGLPSRTARRPRAPSALGAPSAAALPRGAAEEKRPAAEEREQRSLRRRNRRGRGRAGARAAPVSSRGPRRHGSPRRARPRGAGGARSRGDLRRGAAAPDRGPVPWPRCIPVPPRARAPSRRPRHRPRPRSVPSSASPAASASGPPGRSACGWTRGAS